MSQKSTNTGISHCITISQNVNGLKSRLPEFNADVIASNAKIYMICETKIDDTVHSSQIFPEIAIPLNATGKKELIVLDTCHELGLVQINKHSNRNSSTLDLVWTNCVDLITCHKSDYHLLKREVHHPFALEIKIHDFDNNQSKTALKLKYHDFIGADYDVINNNLCNLNWNDILSGIDLEQNISNFYNIINSVISKNVKLKTKSISSHPKWFSRDLINMKNRVNTLHKQKKSRLSAVHEHAELRKQYKACARSAFKNYKLEMEQLIDEDPTKFFDYVNTCRKTHDDLPSEMEYDGNKLSSQQDIADSFADHFTKAYTQNDTPVNNYKDCESFLRDLCLNIPTIDITEDLILETVNKLPTNTVSGPDGIPNIFIKRCIHTLIKPITRILNESFKTGFVPDIWKRSYVRPIHKSGVKTKIDNYRGVALQCAFDSVNIELLIQKLSIMGLNGEILNWIQSYLDGRQQVVKLNEAMSKTIEVTSGTGQGYPIGATLFLLFIIIIIIIIILHHTAFLRQRWFI
ncbi:uncharacterized protein LOC129573426 [Sitodiplosis mosellana]|uniref:uncharacterized protein LOC129573426 n=1 Tax=Sitodiplosis mosellana TaxID=263140 RepID=UPI0024443C66|nr:uncharacterized protein LOC129573426 [Sitodiplosis mosellana]